MGCLSRSIVILTPSFAKACHFGDEDRATRRRTTVSKHHVSHLTQGDREARTTFPGTEVTRVPMADRYYRIVVKDELGPSHAVAFEGMRLEASAGETAIVGPVADQTQLQGILKRLDLALLREPRHLGDCSDRPLHPGAWLLSSASR